MASKTSVLLVLAAMVLASLAAENGVPPSQAAGVLGAAPASRSIQVDSAGTLAGYWINVTQAASPGILTGAAMAYVPELGASLLFGGRIGSFPYSNESRSYNASQNSWTRLTPPTSPPPARIGATMVYDPDLEKVLLFGGASISGHQVCPRNDTWLYDPVSNAWTNVTPLSSPPNRLGAAMAYDPTGHRVVLFGGEWWPCGGDVGGIPEFPQLNDTWIYDAINDTWLDVTPAVSPPEQAAAGLAYDPLRDALVLLGPDTWLLDLGSDTWTQAHPTTAPSARSGQGLAYDAAAKAVVLYGGCGVSSCYNDTWWYADAAGTWVEMPSLRAPPFAPGQSFVYDPSGVLAAYGASQTWQYVVAAKSESLAVDASANVTNPVAPAPVAFQAVVRGAVGPYGYAWSFGDGGSSHDVRPVHVFTREGTYNVTLTITDATNASALARLSISIAAPAGSFPLVSYAFAAGGAAALAVAAWIVWRRVRSKTKGPGGDRPPDRGPDGT